jgi:hypothetical protein
MVQVSIGRIGQLEGAEADVVKGFVVQCEALISVLHKLMDGKSRIVGLNDSIRDLWGRNDTIGAHDTIRILFADLGHKESAHTGPSSSSHRVSDLKTLQDITRFGFLTNHIHDRVDEFSAFGVMALRPIVSSSALAKDKVIGAKETSERSSANGVHGSWFKIRKNGTGDVSTLHTFVEIAANALQLERIVSVVRSITMDAMLRRHHLRAKKEMKS